MSKPVLIGVLALIALVGLIDSSYLGITAINSSPLTCDIAGLDGCNVVAQSEYSKFLGIPLGFYGMAYYSALLILLLAVFVYGTMFTHKLLLLAAFVGLVLSLGFLYIQFGLIGALCIYCLVSALCTFVFAPLAYQLYKRFAPHLPVVIR